MEIATQADPVANPPHWLLASETFFKLSATLATD